MRSRRLRENLTGFLFIGPAMFGVLVFTLGTVLGGFGISFFKWDLISDMHWVGFANYTKVLHDAGFWQALVHTLYFAVLSVPLGLVTGLGIALAVNQKLRGMSLFRYIYFLPVVASPVAVSILWGWMYNVDYGLFNMIATKLHLARLQWLASPTLVIPCIVIMTAWKCLGINMMMFLAGLKAIPSGFYEAAEIDGASKFAAFWRITLPLLSPTIFFLLVTGTIGAFQVFDQIYVMTGGGPVGASKTIVFLVYEHGFKYLEMGYASAIAYLLFVIILAITIVQLHGQKYWVQYSLE